MYGILISSDMMQPAIFQSRLIMNSKIIHACVAVVKRITTLGNESSILSSHTVKLAIYLPNETRDRGEDTGCLDSEACG